MHHAVLRIERVLLLGGLPNVQRLNRIQIEQTVEEVLCCELALDEGDGDLREAKACAEQIRDCVWRDLLLRILVNEDEPIDVLNRQADLSEHIGLERSILLNPPLAPEQEADHGKG